MDIYERARRVAEHIIETEETVRQTARVFGIGKTTVHYDITKTLKRNNPSLYKEAATVLEKHRQERHLRGGAATKAKYENSREEAG